MTALQQNVEDIQFIGNTFPFVGILIQGMNNEYLPGHQLIPFVEESLDRSKKHLFLRDVLKETDRLNALASFDILAAFPLLVYRVPGRTFGDF
jgi:hypothetical protein